MAVWPFCQLTLSYFHSSLQVILMAEYILLKTALKQRKLNLIVLKNSLKKIYTLIG